MRRFVVHFNCNFSSKLQTIFGQIFTTYYCPHIARSSTEWMVYQIWESVKINLHRIIWNFSLFAFFSLIGFDSLRDMSQKCEVIHNGQTQIFINCFFSTFTPTTIFYVWHRGREQELLWVGLLYIIYVCSGFCWLPTCHHGPSYSNFPVYLLAQ